MKTKQNYIREFQINNISKDVLAHTFNFLDRESLSQARLVCSFWKKSAELTKFGKTISIKKATESIYDAILNADVQSVKKNIKQANINKTFNIRIGISDGFETTTLKKLYDCNFLHILIYQWRKKSFLYENKYFEIFKLLLQHNIDINHSLYYIHFPPQVVPCGQGKQLVYLQLEHTEPTTIYVNPKSFFKDKLIDLDGSSFCTLLELRTAELNYEKNGNLSQLIQVIQTIWSNVNFFEREVVLDYLKSLREKNKGLCYFFKEIEKENLFNDIQIQNIINSISMPKCNLM